MEPWTLLNLGARGFQAIPNIYFDPNNITSPVSRSSTVFTLLALGRKRAAKLKQADVKGAFLLPKLLRRVYFKPIPGVGFKDKDKYNGLLALKTIYGLVQSSARYFQKLSQDLKAINFKQSTVDPCLWIYEDGEDYCYLAIHV